MKTVIEWINKSLHQSVPEILLSPFQKRLIPGRKAIKSLRARADAKRSFAEKIADFMTRALGSFWFFAFNVILFTIWIWINLGLHPNIEAFDPFPFGLLTMAVSLEAIILAIFVLISQNREQKINNLREEIDLQVDLITESELTKLMEIVILIAKKNGIDLSKDEELKEMLKTLDKQKIEKALAGEIKI